MSLEQELVGKIQNVLRGRYGDVGLQARRRMFDDYDTNGDGQIDAEELTAILADAGVGNALTRGFWVKGVIARLDDDGDELISFEEFEAVIGEGRRQP